MVITIYRLSDGELGPILQGMTMANFAEWTENPDFGWVEGAWSPLAYYFDVAAGEVREREAA